MAIGHWIKRKKARKIERINKKLVLSAFSANCGEKRQSVEFTSESISDLLTTNDLLDISESFVVEMWIKNRGVTNDKQVLYETMITPANTTQLQISITNSLLVVTMEATGTTTITGNDLLPYNEWVHIAVTFDATTVLLYVNGKVQTATGTPGASMDTDSGISFIFGADISDANSFIGLFYDILVAPGTNAITPVMSTQQYNLFRGDSFHALLQHFRFNGATSDLGGGITGETTWVDDGSTGVDITNGTNPAASSTDDAPVSFGGSFISAQFSVTLTESSNIIYPLTPPDDVNFGLVVKWIDDDGASQRRLLWNTSDNALKINPFPATYAGEKLPTTIVLEVWSHPFKATSDLTSDYTLYISLTSQPTSSFDTTQVADSTLTIDTTLAEPLSLTGFPLEFNTQQTY